MKFFIAALTFLVSPALCLTAHAQEVNKALDVKQTEATSVAAQDSEAIQLLNRLKQAEIKERQLAQSTTTELSYLFVPATGRQKRSFVTTPQQAIDDLTSGSKNFTLSKLVTDGTRYFSERVFLSPDGKWDRREIYSSDDRTTRTYMNDLMDFAGAGRIEDAAPSASLTGARLQQGHPRIVGRPIVNGEQTVQIEATIVSGLPWRYTVWLAPKYDYRAIREDTTIVLNGTEYVTNNNRRENLEFTKFRNTWIPKKWAETRWLVNRQGQKYWARLKYNNLLEVKALSSDKKSIFSLDFPPAAIVNDDTRGLAQREGGNVASYAQPLRDKTLPQDLQSFLTRAVTEETTKAKSTTAEQPTTNPQ